MGRRKSSGAGALLVLLLAAIVAVGQFVMEHLSEILTVCGIGVAIWVAFKVTKSIGAVGETREPVEARVGGEVGPTPAARARAGAQSDNGDAFWRQATGGAEGEDSDLGGMIYVGTGLRAISREAIEPALVNPRLPVAKGIDECRIRRADYWPSYSEASREARGSYRVWLRTGRRDPQADIGYVFLYFYGLERRVLHDSRTSQAAADEVPAIEAEVHRLLQIYGQQRSFARYAGDFLDYVQVIRQPEQSYLSPPIAAEHRGLSFCDRLALAQCAHDGAPLPADWAHYWVSHDANTSLGTAAKRCPDEFKKLFVRIYGERYGSGLSLPKNRTRLILQYRPASASFRGQSEGLVFAPDLMDVTVLTAPLAKLQEVASQVCAQLNPFSRVVGKDPAGAGSFEALVQLPVALWPEQYRQQLEQVRSVVARAGKPAAIPFGKFRSWIPEVADLTRPKLKALARALAGFGLAMEPDFRFGGAPPSLDSRVVVFADDVSTASEEPSARYQAAALTVQLAAAVAMADGSAGKVERDLLSAQAAQWPELTESERRRLQALLRLLFLQGPQLNGLRKRIELLNPAAREAVGDFLIEVAQADNEVSPQEIRTLQRTFGLLGLDVQRVFSQVHGAAVAAEKASEGGSKIDGGNGYAIPSAPRRKRSKASGPEPAPFVAKASTAGPNQASMRTAKLGATAVTPETAAATDAPTLITARPGTSTPKEEVLTAQAGLRLDPRKVAALQRDSERVAQLLASVFEGQPPIDDALPAVADPHENVASESVLGLDAKHSEFLKTLLGRTKWARSELKELAEDRGLLVDGALERLNEAALDQLNAPLFDEGDPIHLNPEAVEGISGAEHSHT